MGSRERGETRASCRATGAQGSWGVAGILGRGGSLAPPGFCSRALLQCAGVGESWGQHVQAPCCGCHLPGRLPAAQAHGSLRAAKAVTGDSASPCAEGFSPQSPTDKQAVFVLPRTVTRSAPACLQHSPAGVFLHPCTAAQPGRDTRVSL